MAHQAQTPGENYLEDYGGNVRTYKSNLATGMRLGKAWFSGLSEGDRALLQGFYIGNTQMANALDTEWSTIKSDQNIREAVEFLRAYHYEMSRP